MTIRRHTLIVFCLPLLISTFSQAQQLTPNNAEKKLLWGDTHLHTYLSLDAYLNKNFSIGPGTAYRFAKGLAVAHPVTNTPVQLETPLDFLVVADHAENLGAFKRVIEGNAPTEGLSIAGKMKLWFFGHLFRYFANSDNGLEKLSKLYKPKSMDVVEAAKYTDSSPLPNIERMQADAWLETINAADEHNDPGNFTAFIGWEWTSIPAGANLHRVIFTSSNAEVAREFQPFSSNHSNYPEDLWRFLDASSQQTGADFIAIPHNSNVSRGFMFPTEKTLRNAPINQQWIELRARWENVVEITQIKGDSETDPTLSPADPFADFESYPYYLIPVPDRYQPDKASFVRSALRTGLALENRYGQNPYKFGLIGSTDSHSGLATAEEANFWSKYAKDALPGNKLKPFGEIENYAWQISASGLAGVWAEENTREAIFAAFKRREVYATTGPRIAVRIYGGSDFKPGDENNLNIAQLSTSAVPMGGELNSLNKAPSFVIQAAKDPKSAHLERIQMVKGWLDGTETFEKVYDVVWAGDRNPDANGQVPKVADNVDPKTGNYTNEHGASTLAAVWIDPDFNPEQPAFYYVRVLEIPTPRHSTLDAIAMNINVEETGKPVSLQERAYTSPIYYSP